MACLMWWYASVKYILGLQHLPVLVLASFALLLRLPLPPLCHPSPVKALHQHTLHLIPQLIVPRWANPIKLPLLKEVQLATLKLVPCPCPCPCIWMTSSLAKSAEGIWRERWTAARRVSSNQGVENALETSWIWSRMARARKATKNDFSTRAIISR